MNSMTQGKPISEERLAEMRAMLDGFQYGTLTITSCTADEAVDAYNAHHGARWAIADLLTEVEWHRAQEAKAQEQIERLVLRNSELRDVVRVVAEADNSDMSVCYQLCSYDMHWTDDEHQVTTHNAPCVVEQARAALGMTGDGEVTTGEQSSDTGDAL